MATRSGAGSPIASRCPVAGDEPRGPGAIPLTLFSTVVRCSRDGIVIIDGAGTILEWNDGEERITGIPRAQAVGRPVWEVQHRLAPDEARAPERLVAARERVLLGLAEGVELRRELEEVIQRPDGEQRTVQTLIFLVRDGAELFACGISRDISERRRMEQAVAEAVRCKDEFLAVLSHELRNPLATLRSGLFVLASAGPDASRRMLAIIERQVSRLARLVDDLLDINRISRGSLELRPEPVELGELARRAVEDHASLFQGRGVDLEVRPAPAPLWLSADAERIVQLIGNLLAHALRVTPAGGRVEVTLAPQGESALLCVRDTGAGMTAQMLDEVFAPVDGGPPPVHGGLGLTMVKALAALHGGSVGAASEGPGRGSALTVRLPLAAAPERRAPAPAAPPGRARRVLIIEDDHDGADFLGEAVELLGHQVQVARDGPSGIAAALSFRPEVVLCDIGLPGMDGYEVARRLRAEAPASLLVALTGFALPGDRQHALEAGFALHLAKPVGIAALADLLESSRAAADA
jgi:PAS domain S-box-containing protein